MVAEGGEGENPLPFSLTALCRLSSGATRATSSCATLGAKAILRAVLLAEDDTHGRKELTTEACEACSPLLAGCTQIYSSLMA